MIIRLIIILIFANLSSQIFASKFKYYTRIEAIYSFANLCPSEAIITPATATTAEVIKLNDALKPEPIISKSYLFSGAVGLDWDIGYKTEISFLHFPRIDYSYQKDNTSDLTQFKYSITSIMGNLVLKFPADRFLIPFCNVGAGYARHYLYDLEIYDKDMKAKTKINNGERWAFAWQIGFGLSWRLNPSMDFDFGYRHLCFDRLDSGLEETDISSTTIRSRKLDAAKSYAIPRSHQIFVATRLYF